MYWVYSDCMFHFAFFSLILYLEAIKCFNLEVGSDRKLDFVSFLGGKVKIPGTFRSNLIISEKKNFPIYLL